MHFEFNIAPDKAPFLTSEYPYTCSSFLQENHYENTPIQIYRKVHHQKLKIFG